MFKRDLRNAVIQFFSPFFFDFKINKKETPLVPLILQPEPWPAAPRVSIDCDTPAKPTDGWGLLSAPTRSGDSAQPNAFKLGTACRAV